ncbi:DUF1801 domain-containing protein [Nonlabens ulvanivorans]|uniref:DUF1801 domain-containing protein n=1 Tax=Nonlabens ulvanivorans TaxID=906888 RepID=A0A090WHA9_NONUL|nr:DUF1801 domain-containing protein [Nonlabens ulvanivorans]GAL74794.1 DUF1801 domain-containing protein [Nonlabens ulvanivorans]
MANPKAKNTQEYISFFPKWKSHFNTIYNVLQNTELEESIKWGGAPCYTLKGKNLIGMVGFKNHCAVWFHKGALLKDNKNALINAQPGKTQLLRQLRYCESDMVDIELLEEYIIEAIAIEKNNT